MTTIINKLFKKHILHEWKYKALFENQYQTAQRDCNCGKSQVYDAFLGGYWFDKQWQGKSMRFWIWSKTIANTNKPYGIIWLVLSTASANCRILPIGYRRKK